MPPEAPAAPETGEAPNLDPTTPPTPAPPDTKEPEDVSGLKAALKAERDARRQAEGRVKELTPYEQKVKEAEEASKSETQKANDALNVERDARTKAERDLLRYTVGAAKGVPPNLVKFLSGSTKQEVEQAADDLLAELGTTKPTMPGRPAERMTNGQPSSSGLDNESPEELIRRGRGHTAAK